MRSKAERIVEIKRRFEECIALFDDRSDGKAVIVRIVARLVRSGEFDGQRTWSTKTYPLEKGISDSLDYLLCEKMCPNKHGGFNTGGNAYWVLNIWERATEELRLASAPACVTEPYDCNCLDGGHDEGDGFCMCGGALGYTRVPKETRIKLVAKVSAPVLSLGMQVINAFVERDEDAIMKLALELDGG